MGSSTSKAAKTASKLPATANTAARKYPTRPPPPSSSRTNAEPRRPTPEAAVGPRVHPETHASPSRDQAINLDSQDPDLALNARLSQLGPVQPNPTFSNSSTFNVSNSHLQSPSRPHQPSSLSSSHSHASMDPTTSVSSFIPSNPSQTIFPSAQQRPGGRVNPAVSLLTARYRLAEEAEKEFAEIGRTGAKGRQFLDVVTLSQVLVMREKGVSGDEIERKLGLRKGVVGRLGGRGVVGVAG